MRAWRRAPSRVRKQPEILTRTFIMRNARSASLLVWVANCTRFTPEQKTLPGDPSVSPVVWAAVRVCGLSVLLGRVESPLLHRGDGNGLLSGRLDRRRRAGPVCGAL